MSARSAVMVPLATASSSSAPRADTMASVTAPVWSPATLAIDFSYLLVAFLLALGLRTADGESRKPFWSAIIALLAAAEFLTFSHSVAGFAVAAVFFIANSIPSRALRAGAWCGARSAHPRVSRHCGCAFSTAHRPRRE